MELRECECLYCMKRMSEVELMARTDFNMWNIN